MVVEGLRAIQEKYGYVPEQELHDLAGRLNMPVYAVHGVATFYPHFRLAPPPKAAIHVCTDLCCHLRHAEALLDEAKAMAAADARIEVKNCSCLGQCDGGPAALINDHPHARQTRGQMLDLFRRAINGQTIEHQHFHTPAGPFKTDPYAGPHEHYAALKALLASGDFAAVPEKIKAANLRGMGGAGTPAFRKWDAVFRAASDKKFIVCNADESEVGTFKDRELLKLLPHLLIEAMTIAAVTTGADQGYIYIRHEYHESLAALEKEIARARSLGIIGPNVLASGKSFDLQIFVSPGGYIQGEETALLEAIEGRRGQPRNKERDVGLIRGVPAFTGLFGKPTIINNVETFTYIPAILLKGPDWFRDLGANGCHGLKWVGISGDVNEPGVFEVAMGTTYTDVIRKAAGIRGGRALKAICPTGATGGLLPAAFADEPMDFKIFASSGEPLNAWARVGGFTSVGSGAIIVLADDRCLVDAALNFTRFFRNESCGKCVPCRVGSQKIVDIIAGIAQGTAADRDLAEIDRLSLTLDLTSICGLGQVVPSPIQSLLKYFRPEVEQHLVHKTCPAGVCFHQTTSPVQNTNKPMSAAAGPGLPKSGEKAP
jgi:NADH:ubiquinone oxidoreductase subunit F (NADH-binding)/NADH:ubiquinone oxidoreductase subunit E